MFLEKKSIKLMKQSLSLLNDRASLAQRIGHSKSLSNQEVYVPHREKEILQRVRDLNRGPLSAQVIACSFSGNHFRLPLARSAVERRFLWSRSDLYASGRSREIRFLSRLAIDGQHPGSLSGSQPGHERRSASCRSKTRPKARSRTLSICWSIRDSADLRGDLFGHSSQFACRAPAERLTCKRIISHPQALAQCRGWLARHFPSIPVDEVASTAHAAMKAAKDGSLAAISSAMAKEVYDLQTVAANIEDQSNNITRFVVIGKMQHEAERRRQNVIWCFPFKTNRACCIGCSNPLRAAVST